MCIYIYIYILRTYIYIYIYTYYTRTLEDIRRNIIDEYIGCICVLKKQCSSICTAENPLPTRLSLVVDFRGFDSSIILISRGGISRPRGDFPESLSRAMFVGCNVSRETGRTNY